jgi:hypothetical protein
MVFDVLLMKYSTSPEVVFPPPPFCELKKFPQPLNRTSPTHANRATDFIVTPDPLSLTKAQRNRRGQRKKSPPNSGGPCLFFRFAT